MRSSYLKISSTTSPLRSFTLDDALGLGGHKRDCVAAELLASALPVFLAIHFPPLWRKIIKDYGCRLAASAPRKPS